MTVLIPILFGIALALALSVIGAGLGVAVDYLVRTESADNARREVL